MKENLRIPKVLGIFIQCESDLKFNFKEYLKYFSGEVLFWYIQR